MVQWLKLHIPNAGGSGSIPEQGTRPHTPQLRVGMLQLKKKILMLWLKILFAATQTSCSQINIKERIVEQKRWLWVREIKQTSLSYYLEQPWLMALDPNECNEGKGHVTQSLNAQPLQILTPPAQYLPWEWLISLFCLWFIHQSRLISPYSTSQMNHNMRLILSS